MRAVDRWQLGVAFLSGLALGSSFPKCGFAWFAWIVPGLLLLGMGQPPATASALARELAFPMIAVAAVLGFGWTRLASPESATRHLKVALVQPGIPQSIIWEVNERTNHLHKLLELHRHCNSLPGVVFPSQAPRAAVIERRRSPSSGCVAASWKDSSLFAVEQAKVLPGPPVRNRNRRSNPFLATPAI